MFRASDEELERIARYGVAASVDRWKEESKDHCRAPAGRDAAIDGDLADPSGLLDRRLGRAEGEWTTFDAQGRHERSGPCRAGLAHGEWRTWDAGAPVLGMKPCEQGRDH